MGGKIAGSMISCMMLSFLILVSVSFFMFEEQEERVCDICYDYAEIISTKREFSEDNYSYFCSALSKYGSFEADFVLETETENGYRDVFYGKENVVGKQLKKGDVITLAVYYTDATLVEKLVGRQVRMSALKKAVVV